MINGMINVRKEKGYTSHDVVARMRGILKQKKIGHTGTLDPEAEGVLPICLGNGTKLCGMLTEQGKEYVAEFLLGVTTDTQDMTGTVLTQQDVTVTEEQVREAVLGFAGDYEQVPPMYSALKVNGKKLYELARAGKEVERKARNVQIREIELLKMELPAVTIRVACSKGTYIRTLCHDIGLRLGCGAAMKSLLRTEAAGFRLEEAYTLSQLEKLREEGGIGEAVVPVDEILREFSPVKVKPEFCRLVENGNPLFSYQLTEEIALGEGEQVRVYDRGGKFYGLYGFDREKGYLRPVKMFLE